jgi:hypothetical protein
LNSAPSKTQTTDDMKNNLSQPAFYFSAYPLKALKQTSGEDTTSEKSTLHISNNSKAIGRVRVHPMANPYKSETKATPRVKPSKLKEDTGENSNGWYGNYE